MDDGESECYTAVGPGEVEVFKRTSEGDDTFNGRCAIGWVVTKHLATPLVHGGVNGTCVRTRAYSS
jgi:hypothetical protein